MKQNLSHIKEIAIRYKWQYQSSDAKVGRISFSDEMNVIRLDIYTTKMTVCFLSKECAPKYFKKQTLESIEKIMRDPYIILWEHK